MFFLVEFWAWIVCAEVVLAIQHLLGYCILGETSQRRSAPVTKFSQPRAWISLKRVSVAPRSKLCCVIPFFILIIFRSIIQFLVVLFPLLLWLHQHIPVAPHPPSNCSHQCSNIFITTFHHKQFPRQLHKAAKLKCRNRIQNSWTAPKPFSSRTWPK